MKDIGTLRPPSPIPAKVHIPDLRTLGIPEKFEKLRPYQAEAISVMITPSHRARVVCGPTGFGKTLAYVVAAKLSKKPTLIVVMNKGHQDQILADFPFITDLRGRDNYKCGLREEYSCQDGYAGRCPYKGSAQCPASMAELKMAGSWIGVTNYAKWVAAKRRGTGMEHWTQVVFDEGHEMPNALADSMQVNLGSWEINEVLKIDFPTGADIDSVSSWKTWATYAKNEAEDEMFAVKEKINNSLSSPKSSWVKHYTHMRELVRKLSILSTMQPDNWVPDQAEKGFVFDPIRPGKYGEAMLTMHMEHIIAVSATIRPKTMWLCGMGSSNFIFREYPSEFNPDDCPVYYIPTMPIDERHPDQNQVLVLIDQIASRRRDRKGIIHTISHKRKDDIVRYSRYGPYMLFNKRREPITVVLEDFKNSGPGTILCTPSVGIGYDFPGDACEWQFIYKIPFEPPSKIVKAREIDDPDYRGYKAMQSLIQMFGRGARYKGDRCENFIGDDNLRWFLPQSEHLAPNWFKNFFRPSRFVPDPLQKL